MCRKREEKKEKKTKKYSKCYFKIEWFFISFTRSKFNQAWSDLNEKKFETFCLTIKLKRWCTELIVCIVMWWHLSLPLNENTAKLKNPRDSIGRLNTNFLIEFTEFLSKKEKEKSFFLSLRLLMQWLTLCLIELFHNQTSFFAIILLCHCLDTRAGPGRLMISNFKLKCGTQIKMTRMKVVTRLIFFKLRDFNFGHFGRELFLSTALAWHEKSVSWHFRPIHSGHLASFCLWERH